MKENFLKIFKKTMEKWKNDANFFRKNIARTLPTSFQCHMYTYM